MIEFFFNSVCLTHVGCTHRLLKRPVLRRMEPHFTVGGSQFGPEMMLVAIILGVKLVQIPVNCRPRVGTSAVTGDLVRAFFLGLRMIAMIWLFRWRQLVCRMKGRPMFTEPATEPRVVP